MTHSPSRQHRTHAPAPERVTLRDTSDTDADDGLFRIRMPVTSTAEARDGIAFDRAKVAGFAEQIDGERIPVFLDHGRNEQTGARYSALGKVGYLDAPELRERDAATDLEADFVLVDPAELDSDAGRMREALSWLRTQARLGLPIASSIGWSDETGERDLPGDADLLEASIVGIPSDARTSTAAAPTESVVARAVETAADGFDIAAFERALRDERARAEYDVGDETVDITPPEAMQNAASLALARKADGLGADCGTGVGEDRARQIVNDNVGPDVIDEVAAYLTSHAEDVSADGPPSDWNDSEWDDCGNMQYALWGGTGSGEQRDWAQGKANRVADAKGEELPYPDRARNLDDPQFSEGDAVMWTWQGDTVHGRVADVGDEFTVSGNTITGEEGEAVYLIHDYDEETETYDEAGTAKPESSLDESSMDLPPATEETLNSMTETSDDDSTDSDGREAVRALRADMEDVREMMEENTRLCREMHEEMMGPDEENAEDMDDEDGDEDGEDEDMNESAADPDNSETAERRVTVDGEEMAARDAVAKLRSDLDDVDPDAPDAVESKTRTHADDDSETTDDDAAGFGFAGMED